MKRVLIGVLMMGVVSRVWGLVIEEDSGGGLIPGGEVTASGLEAGRVVMQVVAENIANQHTTKDKDGRAYKAKQVVLGTQAGGKVLVKEVVRDKSDGAKVYNPQHPHADGEGYVELSNVEVSQEMVNLTLYSRWVEAQYAAANASVKMAQEAVTFGN